MALKGLRNFWDLFDFYDIDNTGKTKKTQIKSGKFATLIYKINVDSKDTYPPVITKINIKSQNLQIQGSFNISQKNNKVKHLRVHFSPYNYFPEDNREYVDVEEGDYESIQNTGIKHFSFDASKWEGKVVYWKIEAENKDGIKQLYPAKGSVYVKEYEATKVKSAVNYIRVTGIVSAR